MIGGIRCFKKTLDSFQLLHVGVLGKRGLSAPDPVGNTEDWLNTTPIGIYISGSKY
jgi:hypothetical protein